MYDLLAVLHANGDLEVAWDYCIENDIILPTEIYVRYCTYKSTSGVATMYKYVGRSKSTCDSFFSGLRDNHVVISRSGEYGNMRSYPGIQSARCSSRSPRDVGYGN